MAESALLEQLVRNCVGGHPHRTPYLAKRELQERIVHVVVPVTRTTPRPRTAQTPVLHDITPCRTPQVPEATRRL